MPSSKSGFLDRVLGRISRLDHAGLQTVVQRLARERKFLDTVFNAIEDGILVIDEQGRIVYLNDATTHLVGIPESAEGEFATRYIPNLDWQQLNRLDREGGSAAIRQEIEVQYPQPRFLRVYATALDGEAEGSTGVALILHDTTEVRQTTTEAVESERIHALTLLAASVAHEIGNPLNALHIHLQLFERELKRLKLLSGLAKRDLPPRGRSRNSGVEIQDDVTAIVLKLENYLSVAQGEISRLDYIITEFLQALRPKPPRFEQASINDVAIETLQLLGPEISNRGIVIEKNLRHRLPMTRCDPGQMKQVLVNLIKNAIQAMTKGGSLAISTGTTSEDVWISVAYTGTGIPPEQQKAIFEPFYTTKQKGTGLGLMIVERIMRAHGGRIELTSQVGIGTTFKLWLPLPGRGLKLLPN